MKPLFALFFSAWIAASLASASARAAEPPLKREPLRLKNSFATPEEVVAYYCSRDAQGFIWSGFLEAERRAFTFWPETVEHDSFYVARSYAIRPDRDRSPASDRARVEVQYELDSVASASGSRMPAAARTRTVVFELRKSGERWKIVSPSPAELPPVLSTSTFVRDFKERP